MGLSALLGRPGRVTTAVQGGVAHPCPRGAQHRRSASVRWPRRACDADRPAPRPPCRACASRGPHVTADEPGDLRRWLRRIVLGLVLLVAVLTVTVSISRCGPDDGASGGEPQGLSVAVTPASPG